MHQGLFRTALVPRPSYEQLSPQYVADSALIAMMPDVSVVTMPTSLTCNPLEACGHSWPAGLPTLFHRISQVTGTAVALEIRC